jgi:hypothetical protein
MRGRAWSAAVAAVVLAGCTPASQQPSAAWAQVALPPHAHIASLAVAGDGVLVGGYTDPGTTTGGQTQDEAAPLLIRVAAGGSVGSVALHPAEPYAAVADLISLTVAGDRVHAIGKAVGGAHANPRLTVWDGTLSGAGLTSRPQGFFTFGGHDAGPLLGTEVVAGAPVIFGSRTTDDGPEGLVWTYRGGTWTQQAADPALVSTPDRELGFGALARWSGYLVVAGDELGLTGGLDQRPSAFVGAPTGGWRQLTLPLPDGLLPAARQLSRATSVACPEAEGACWMAGWARGRALVWPLSLTADGAASAGAPATLAGDPPADGDPAAVVTLVDGHPAVFTNAASPTLQLGCADGWRSLAAPTPAVTAALATADRLYAVAGGALWVLPAPHC